MNAIELKDIVRKDTALYYRRLFTATVSLDILGSVMDRRVEFIIETHPTGKKDVSVTLVDPVEYPLVPILRSIKELVAAMDGKGALP